MVCPILFGALCASFNLRNARLGNLSTISLCSVSLYLCGFYYPQQWYAWLAAIPLTPLTLRVLVLTTGGCCLLLIFATDNVISRRFNGSISRALGKLSFALYLVHLLILSSVSAWGYSTFEGGVRGTTAAAIIFVIAAIPVVYAISLFDSWWLKILNRWHVRAIH